MRAALAFLPALWLTGSVAAAHSCVFPQYANRQSRSEQIAEVTSKLIASVDEIEGVPPAESEYIYKELRDAIRSNSSQRTKLVTERPFFQADRVRGYLNTLKNDSYQAISSSKIKDQSKYILNTFRDVYNIDGFFDVYVKVDRNRSPPVLNSDKINAIHMSLLNSKIVLEDSLRCAIEELKEP